MADEFSRAISFANGYFSLVDGLAMDLEDYLAEDVVLDWFGQTIRGRENVAAFMKYKKTSSRHIFNEIEPKMTIGYHETRPLRRKYHSAGGSIENSNCTTENDNEYQVNYKRKCYSETFSGLDGSFSEDSGLTDVLECEMDTDNLNKTEESVDEYKLEITDSIIRKELNMEALNLDNFTTPRVTCKPEKTSSGKFSTDSNVEMAIQLEPTIMDDIEMNIAELKARKLFQIEQGQGDAEESSLKFLEACGVIEFYKVFNAHQIRKNTRKRHCKLQIAYSVKDENYNSALSHHDLKEIEICRKKENNSECRLPEIEAFTEDEDERNEFLQCLQLQMMKQVNNINHLSTPKYVNKQLKFNNPQKRAMVINEPDDSGEFVFNYEIHVIIYGSSTKCRLNLSHEFDGKEYSED